MTKLFLTDRYKFGYTVPITMPCAELKQRFPNLYTEPMQMDNSENKSYDTIPYNAH